MILLVKNGEVIKTSNTKECYYKIASTTPNVHAYECNAKDFKNIYNILLNNTKTFYNLINNKKAKRIEL